MTADPIILLENVNKWFGDFHVLQERLGTGNTTERFRADTRLQFNKFLPQSWGFKIPFNISFSENLITPKYLPGTDIVLSRDVAPDSILTKGRQFSYNTSFAKTTKSDNWLTRYTLDNIKLNYSSGRSLNSDVQTLQRINRNNAGGASSSIQRLWESARWLCFIFTQLDYYHRATVDMEKIERVRG